MYGKIVAVGDCNTSGAGPLRGKSYPEEVGGMIGAEVLNLGTTMATTHEGVRLLNEKIDSADCVFIQFGLADSHKTIKCSPYVLYYPDNIFRKYSRSIIKKFKKLCRKAGMDDLLGQDNVVGPDEYERNIRTMIQCALPRTIFLIDTIPHLRTERNAEIRKYNGILDKICKDYEKCHKIDLYTLFEQQLGNYYQDQTHCNATGYGCIAGIIREKLGTIL